MVDQYVPAPAQGWARWTEQEIRVAEFVLLVCTETYLRRVEGREQPGKGRGVVWEVNLIYNLLYPEDADIQKFIPVLFKTEQPSSIPLPLRGINHYRVDTDEGYEDLCRHFTKQPRHQMPGIGKRIALPPKEPQSFPSSTAIKAEAKQPSSLDQRHRQQMIKQVRLDWIDGVLNQSLYKVARIALGLTGRSDFVEQPLNAVVQIPDRSPQVVPPGKPISKIFDEQAGALLILGAPGVGKTTLLLELARDLLDRAEADESQPIPVVFNLSSWAGRRQSLSEWLMAELNERSYVPKRVARQWVEGEQILPLLDGLDEVAAGQRDECVDAINNFRREHGLLPIAVCSRIADYQALGTKLRLRSAVEVQPLTRPQVEDYLERVGEPLKVLRDAVTDDPAFWELMETPLMLWVAMLAYKTEVRVPVHGESLERRRHDLFERFVEATYRRRGGKRRYGPEQTTRWLSYLARTLTMGNWTAFYLENLSFDWLLTRTNQWLARWGLFLMSGLIFGLVIGLIVGLDRGLAFGLGKGLALGLKGLFTGLASGMIVGLIGVPILTRFGNQIRIRPVEKARFRIAPSLRKTKPMEGLGFGLSLGFIWGVLLGQRFGWIFGLMGGLLFGLIFGLIKMFSFEEITETRHNPNQGTRRSVRMGLFFGLIGGMLSGGLTLVLIRGGSAVFDPNKRLWGLILGMCGVPVGFMVFGGLFALKHFILRLSLWLSRSAPLRYVTFLNEAKDLLFLRQVGGGYIFTHRLLRDYFASLPESKREPGQRSKAATAS